MANELFRKKSLEKIQSPESLNDYIRVANPGVWLLLLSLVALLLGACLWGFFGRIEVRTEANAAVAAGNVTLSVSAEQKSRIPAPFFSGEAQNVSLQIGNERYDISVTMAQSAPADGGKYTFSGVLDLPDGTYDAVLVLESIRPLSFIWN